MPCRAAEYMRIHGMGDKAPKAHIRAIKHFAGFLGRSPDTATPDDLRAYQLQMTDTEVTPPTFNARIMALRFLFGTTCDREEMKKYMQFCSPVRHERLTSQRLGPYLAHKPPNRMTRQPPRSSRSHCENHAPIAAGKCAS
jgi:hypothetical protein